MISKILVPVDGSEHAYRALSFAADLAEKYRAEIVVVHALTDWRLPEALERFAESEHLEGPPEYIRYKLVGESLLKEAEARLKGRGLSRVRTTALSGDPAQEILREAAEIGADLIVMGNRGLSDVKGLLIGSVSHKVTSLAPCTVITVK